MIVKNVYYSDFFSVNAKKLPLQIQKIANNKIRLFKQNPLHPSLRLHSLKGSLQEFYSISINAKYRIVFKRALNGDIIFISIGKHDIYKYL